jgi:segregation and condensation protein A
MEHAQENVYRRTAPKLSFDAPVQRMEVSIFDLVNAVNVILKRFAPTDSRDVFEDKWTVSEKIEAIVNLIRERPAVKFSELFAEATSRTEVVVTFLAMLELIRLKQIVIAQTEEFSEIEISQAPPQPVAPPPEPPTETAPAPAVELNLRMN